MNSKVQNLIEAQEKAEHLFREIENRKLICAGISERDLNRNIYELARELFGIRKYWHKRIVRAGSNTLFPYDENPPDLILQPDDILFLDFGPVFEDWEADIGKTYVLGDDAYKIKLKEDVIAAWEEGRDFYVRNQHDLTGADFYYFTADLAKKYGWEYGNEHCGHLIGNFPHERIQGDEIQNYLHPHNTEKMNASDIHGEERFWIYELHFVDKDLKIGSFFEKLLI
ncbi:Metallopeptidase family M24 [Chryseobacterium oleae]|uniref:Metallopeptidase family M24 n=1 Tax=Chryseobacterium oleae TaxID=491207 RepID=A0A1I5AXT8_CHROL|nr:M24 family metallopeptidase [Chryseobacterium oleae]SFN67232.1 Metallopeptidase family M24 [Chryseobacterium oleae]